MTSPLYDRIGVGYASYRRPDPRIAARVAAALGAARTVVNVGAGSGSYEPEGVELIAVEPSAGMIRQRAAGAAPAIRGIAEQLPFPDRSFDAALAILTIHHWADWRRGMEELQRVARDRVVILTFDPDYPPFWLVRDYFPENVELDRNVTPSLNDIAAVLGEVQIRPVPIPADCSDGFLGAYWQRPEMYLDAGARQAISSFSRLSNVQAGLDRLAEDLDSGRWERRNGWLRTESELDVGYRLITGSTTMPDSGFIQQG